MEFVKICFQPVVGKSNGREIKMRDVRCTLEEQAVFSIYFHHFDREEILARGYFSYLRIFKW